MPEPNNVLDVLTVKRGDNRPELSMTLDEINEASEQPTEDATWDKYSVGEFDDANRYELHMDWYNPDTDEFERVVDGREAEWDTQNEEISIQLQRSDVALEGEYYFEWVIVYDEAPTDGDVPTSATADEVNTVPSKGFFNLSVEQPTSREIGEREPVDRTVGTLTVETYVRGPDGPLPLAGSSPTEANHATTKQYVDNSVEGKADSTHDHSGETLGTEAEPTGPIYSSELSVTDADAETLRTEEIRHIPREGTKNTSPKRPLISSERTVLRIAPDGDDSNPGTPEEPIASIQEALDRLPIFVQHQFLIQLEPGTYGPVDQVNHAGRLFIAGVPHSNPFAIESTTGNRDDVVIQSDIQLSPVSNEADDAFIRDVTVSNRLTNMGGMLKIKNVHFSGEDNVGGHGLPCHSPSWTEVQDCTFDPTLDYAAQAAQGGRIMFNGCDGSVEKYACQLRGDGTVIEAGDNTLWGHLGFADHDLKTSKYINRDGETFGENVRLMDDWGDGRLGADSSAVRFRPGVAGYRPAWDQQDGSPSAGDGFLQLPDGSATTQSVTPRYDMASKMTTGRWVLDVELQDSPTEGAFGVYPLMEDFDNFWSFVVDYDGSVSLSKRIEGTMTNDLATGTMSIDTDRHLIEILRYLDGDDNENWTLRIDGSNQETIQDDYVPMPVRKFIYSNLDVESRVYHFMERLDSGP